MVQSRRGRKWWGTGVLKTELLSGRIRGNAAGELTLDDQLRYQNISVVEPLKETPSPTPSSSQSRLLDEVGRKSRRNIATSFPSNSAIPQVVLQALQNKPAPVIIEQDKITSVVSGHDEH